MGRFNVLYLDFTQCIQTHKFPVLYLDYTWCCIQMVIPTLRFSVLMFCRASSTRSAFLKCSQWSALKEKGKHSMLYNSLIHFIMKIVLQVIISEFLPVLAWAICQVIGVQSPRNFIQLKHKKRWPIMHINVYIHIWFIKYLPSLFWDKKFKFTFVIKLCCLLFPLVSNFCSGNSINYRNRRTIYRDRFCTIQSMTFVSYSLQKTCSFAAFLFFFFLTCKRAYRRK
jgi:hypothetical protein